MVKLVKRAPPAAKKLLASHDLAIELSSNEGPTESRLLVAQNLWGEANLRPQDGLFGSTAIIALVVNPTSAFAVLAPHLSGRLTRLSEESAIWIDAFEAEPMRFSLDRRSAAKIRRTEWSLGKGQLAKPKFTSIYLAEPGRLASSVRSAYQEASGGLRRGGQLFAADLMVKRSAEAAQTMSGIEVPGQRQWLSRDAHVEAIAAANLKIDQEYDLTKELMTTIRSGFLRGLTKLADTRALPQPWRSQRLAAFLQEIEAWFKLYYLLELGHVTATGILATKG